MACISLLFPSCFLLFTTLLSSASPTLLLPLTHTLSTNQQSSATATFESHHHHLLKTATLRSTARHRRQQTHHQGVSLPLSSGSDYTLSFSIGTHHSQTVSLYMDTGSDLVWLPCSPFECILCEGKPPAAPLSTNFNHSTPVSCLSPSCSAAHSSLPTSDLCAISGCPLETIETSFCSSFSCPPFYYAYGDGSLVAGLRHDHISIPSSSKRPIQIPKFTFGCAHTTLAEPIGVAGFGRGLLSLPAQLAQLSPHLGKRFSYCLVSHSFDSTGLRRPSPLILGRNELHQSDPDPFVYTQMLDNPKHPYYYSVSLVAISIGGSKIHALTTLTRVDDNGNGGFVVDSGTTFTMLPEKMYKPVAAEFKKRMGRFGYQRATQIEEETGLSPCYYHYGEGTRMVPSLALHFAGNASVVLPRRNYYVWVERGGKKAGCLMLMNGGDDVESGPAGTLGNMQQQGFEVVYDLEGRRVGFARRRCAELWDAPATHG